MRGVIILLFAGLLAGCVPNFGGRVFAPGVAGESREDQIIVGERLMQAGEYELALRAFNRAALREGLTAETLAAIGTAQLALGRIGQAEASLRRATQQPDATPRTWNNLGVVLMEARKFPEAVLVFRRAFATDSGNSQIIRDNLAKALASRDEPAYHAPQNEGPRLIGRGTGDVALITR